MMSESSRSSPLAHVATIAGAAAMAVLGLTLAACGGGEGSFEPDTHAVGLEDGGAATATHVAATGTYWGGVQIAVGGISVEKIKGLRIAGANLLPTILSSADSGAATIVAGEQSVVFLIPMTPAQLGIFDGAAVELETSEGIVAGPPADFSMPSANQETAAADMNDVQALATKKPKCPKLTWQKPTTLPKVAGCGYNGTSCGRSDRAHTGVDYGGSGDVVATADGFVLTVEKMNSKDHGMGSNVILMHIHNCQVIYSSYSHLASIDDAMKKHASVKRGAIIGKSGGSGYGKSDYWGKHLHFEIKALNVSGNPRGVGKQNKTCGQDPTNAGPSTCWGYVDKKLGASAYGYFDPGSFF